MSNIEPQLFRPEDLEEVKLTPDPVTCLGIEFPSDDARREYFREELRKKLPELKKIEGFPIGEDDDIINLSDPPYYTACPNPWLNDFIQQWEEEKVKLEKDGKRKANFEVKAPYASDVSEGKNNPIYMGHSYHTKVPHTAIMRYILHYTQPGDIVLDGFCGTGMTGVATNLCASANEVYSLGGNRKDVGARHAICSDLSPMATLISASYNEPFDPKLFRIKTKNILKTVDGKYGWLFQKNNEEKEKVNFTVWSDVFVCPNCGGDVNFWDVAINLKEQTIANEFHCPHCGTQQTKKTLEKKWHTYYDSVLDKVVSETHKIPVLINYTRGNRRTESKLSEKDIEYVKRNTELKFSDFKSIRMQDGDESRRNDRIGITHVHQFYTKRTLVYLSEVYQLAKNDPILLAWFTSVVQVASKMYSFRLNRKNGTMKGTLYVPSLVTECNPYNLLENKIESFIKANYEGRGNYVTSQFSATNLSLVPDECIDYMFVDPPFGANIMYSELSSIWEGWIRVQTNNKTEAIINKTQNKSLFEYQDLMNRALKEFYRVLKPGKWLSMEFSNTSAAVWNSIQNALQGVGFVVVNVAALDKKQGSFKAVTTTTAVKQDLVITCYKPSDELSNKFNHSTDKSGNTMDFIEELLVHLPVHLEKENSTTAVVERSPKILYDRLISYYVQHGYSIPMDAQEFQQDLRDRFIERDGMFFTASQALEYEEKKAKTTDFVPMALFIGSEADGIEWLKRELETPQTCAELQPKWLKDKVATKKGDILPELKDILKENFIEDENGKWRNPDAEKAADLEIIRGRKMMKEFNGYLEQAQKPKAKRMKDTRLEVLRYGFKECYKQKDYQSIVTVGDHIQESLLQEDEILLQYYDIATTRI